MLLQRTQWSTVQGSDALGVPVGQAALAAAESALAPALTWALGAGLLERTADDRVALTLSGRLLSNEVFVRLV